MDKIKLLYVTCKDSAEAQLIGTKLVEEKLAACVNIIQGMQSIYRWNGAIESSREAILIVKTTVELAPNAGARIKKLHSYETPCVLHIPINGGNPDYINWLLHETEHK